MPPCAPKVVDCRAKIKRLETCTRLLESAHYVRSCALFPAWRAPTRAECSWLSCSEQCRQTSAQRLSQYHSGSKRKSLERLLGHLDPILYRQKHLPTVT